MEQRPILLICCGLPFAGKSTLATRIALARESVHIALDDVMARMGLWMQREPITQAQWDHADTVAHGLISEALHSGQSVIYDSTNHTRQERDQLRAVATAANSETRVIYIATSPEVVRARIAANRAQPQRGDITDAQLNYVIAHLDMPTADEGVISCAGDAPVEAWLALLPQR